MKNSILLGLLSLVVIFTLDSCEKEDQNSSSDPVSSSLKAEDQEALLFMLEEEKLARDTYQYLDSIYGLQQLANIASSEQKHMDAIVTLLDDYGISYTILPAGQFSDADLQAYFNLFKHDGQTSDTAALLIGATIEDLDIVDLQEYIDASDNNVLIDVFAKLQCGSRNHIRAFTSSLNTMGLSYQAQFLSDAELQAILAGGHEHCNN